jgi:hypothetical protein
LDLEGENIYTLQGRLENAIYDVSAREVVRAFKQVLTDALRLEPPAEFAGQARAFLEGQEQLVRLIEERIEKLEGDLNEEVHVPRLPEL